MERLIQKSVLSHFDWIEDPRVEGRCRHKLIDIISIAACAFVCGAQSFLEMEEFGKQREPWFREFLELPNGIPSHDTFLRVFTILKPSEFEQCFQDWVDQVKDIRSKRVCVDGKTVNGTERGFNKAHRPLTLVNVYCQQSGLTLAQRQAPSTGSAEVNAAMACLDGLDLQGTLVSMDAGLAKPVLLGQLRKKQKAHYLVPIKKNLPLYWNELEHFFSNRKQHFDRAKARERNRGRIESRSCRLVSVENWSDRFHEAFAGVEVAFEITRTRDVPDKRYVIQKTDKDGRQYYEKNTSERRVTEEKVYYVSSKKITAKKALEEVRKHWAIENTLHWSLDVTFGEDDCQVRQKVAARNLALLRKIAFNLVQRASGKQSKRIKLKKAAWNPDYLEKLLLGTA